MGSIQKRKKYERLNNKYGVLYDVPGDIVGRIRSMAITGGKTREEIIEHFDESWINREKEITKMKEVNERLRKGITFLSTGNIEEFNHMTEVENKKA